MVCFKEPEPEFILIKHHVSYFPEIIAFVHYECHKKIHNAPLNQFIQYKKGDSRKFYSKLKHVFDNKLRSGNNV
mgnify:CR=1 FL=1